MVVATRPCGPPLGQGQAGAKGGSGARSLMAKMAPPGEAAHFGLFALSGRATGFAGPAALAAVTQATASRRAGMAPVREGKKAAGIAPGFTGGPCTFRVLGR